MVWMALSRASSNNIHIRILSMATAPPFLLSSYGTWSVNWTVDDYLFISMEFMGYILIQYASQSLFLITIKRVQCIYNGRVLSITLNTIKQLQCTVFMPKMCCVTIKWSMNINDWGDELSWPPLLSLCPGAGPRQQSPCRAPGCRATEASPCTGTPWSASPQTSWRSTFRRGRPSETRCKPRSRDPSSSDSPMNMYWGSQKTCGFICGILYAPQR